MHPPEPRDLRSAFGRFMTGVTVVTTRAPDGTPRGFTANAFTSVSLDPPLLLVCPAKSLSSYRAFAACSHFAVSVLAEGQEDISNIFASHKGDRFAQVAHGHDAHGTPLIDGAAAQFSCATHQVIDAGDHCVLLGRVLGLSHRDAPGLGYAGGRYFSLGLERGALEPTDRQGILGAIVEADRHVLLEETATGLRPPQIQRHGRAQLRADLAEALAQLGVTAPLGVVYSVFDDANTHSAYLMTYDTAAALVNSPLVAVPIDALPSQTYTTQAIADMMARYAVEARTRDFSLYLGDDQSGETHRLLDRR